MGRNIVLLLEKTSTRTRCAFEVAGRDLGMGVTFLDPASSQMGRKESIEDTAPVLGRMYDGIEYRGFSQNTVEVLAKYAGVPVCNGLTDQFHPTQMLADLLTIDERFHRLEGIKLTFMGDACNNITHLSDGRLRQMGMHFTACAPASRFPAQSLVQTAREIAEKNGGSVTLTSDVSEGTRDADVLYTDIWVSIGRTGVGLEGTHRPSVALSGKPGRLCKRLLTRQFSCTALPALSRFKNRSRYARFTESSV